MSFNIGELPRTYFGERGLRTGLSVQLLAPARRVEIWYGQALLALSGELEMRGLGFRHVVVQLGMEGLSVDVGGVRAIANVTVREWAPLATWRMGFGARTSAARCDAHAVDNVRVRIGGAYREHTLPLEVSMNGQQHTQDALPFTFYAEPVVSQLRYDRGPVSGGTSVAMSGSSFRGGSAYRLA